MPRTSGPCPHCGERLNIGTRGLFLDANGRPVREWRRAAWKTCPECSKIFGAHVFVPFPAAYSGDGSRVLNGEVVPQDRCRFHRDYTHGNDGNAGVPNPEPARRVCSARGIGTPTGPDGTGARPAARGPTVRRGADRGEGDGDGQPEVPLTSDQLDALAAALTDRDQWSEEGRRFVRKHVATERSPANRRQILRLRSAQGPLTCDGCGVNLGDEYGPEHAQVVELHHVVPLAHGPQRPTGTESFKLLCPTCHRVVHYRREDPMTIEELKRLLR